MSDKVLKFWWRYLTWFLSYREYSRGGGAESAPPSGARVKRHFLKHFLIKFNKIFREGVKLMSDKVLEVWWRYPT